MPSPGRLPESPRNIDDGSPHSAFEAGSGFTVLKWALAIAALLALLAVPAAHGGPVILGGDDLPLHGCYTAGANQQGWLYIQKAMAKMFASGCITRPNDGSIAALGVADPGTSPPTGFCDGSSDDGGSAIHFAAGVALGKNITYYNGASGPGSVGQFFADLSSNTAKPAVIWICSGLGDLTNELDPAEIVVINANALSLASFVNSGGGLMSHTSVPDGMNWPVTMNQWLPSVVPGLSEVGGCNSSGATLTPAGIAAFPGLSNSDINASAGPCHSHFQGPLGSLQVLVLDGDNPPVPYIIGGDCGTQICEQCDLAPDTCCAIPPTFSGVEAPSFSTNMLVGTREPFGTSPYSVTVYDLNSPPPSPLEDKNWASMVRWNGPFGSWNQDSLGSVFGLTVDDYGNIFVTQASCYNFDYIAKVAGGAPGGIYRLDATTGVINTFCVLPNVPDPGVTGGGNWPCLGNISYDCRHKQFFVTDLEDGRIYRIKPTSVNAISGTVVQFFDPLAPDNGTPGWAPLGERLWGVQWHGDRVYYGVWAEDDGAPSGTISNEVRSVGLFPNGAIDPSSDRHEIYLPTLPGQLFSNPVSDISFSAAGKMLIGERGIQAKTISVAFEARALEYECVGGCWLPAFTFDVGPPGPPLLCAGGVDYDRYAYSGGTLGRVWASADLMHHLGSYPDVLSGYQGFRPTGGNHLNSLLLDADGVPAITEKTFIGDVEVVGCPGAYGTVCGQKFDDLNLNGVRDGGEPVLPGWTIKLTGSSGTVTATTDGNGHFCFSNVVPGNYTLSEVLQAGWVQTAPATGSFNVTVVAGQVLTGFNFGNYTCGGVGGGSCATAPPNMAAWWPFDETAGSLTAADITHLAPSKNVAQLSGGAAITASGHTGRMLCVPGELDYAVVPNANQLGLQINTTSFAIDSWVNLNPGSAGPRMLAEKRVLISAGPYKTRGWALYFNGLQAYLEIGIGISTQIVPGPSVTASAWNHLAVSVDRISGQGRWYLNGVLVPAWNFVPITGGVQSNADLYMGRTSPPFPLGQAFDGCIDDLEIFTAPLTPQTVASLYAAGAAGKCPDVVRLPDVTTICSSQSSVLVCFNICNTSAGTANYHWSLSGLPAGPGCTVNGPLTFSPASGTLTLAPGACSASICVTIPRPAGLTAQNATSCYQLTVVNDGTGACIQRQGKIQADNTCFCAAPATTNLVSIPARMPPGVLGIGIGWGVSHPCDHADLPYRISAMYEPTDHPDPLAIKLNGLPPGEPVIGTLSVDPLAPSSLEVQVSLARGYDPAALYQIVLEADTDGDGVYERMGSTGIVATYDEDETTSVPAVDPQQFLKLSAAPNPFSAGSTIRFALAEAEHVDLAVYDAGGRLVRRLAHGTLVAGPHAFDWDGRDAGGREAAIGIYFVKMRSASRDLGTKLVKLN